MAFNIQQFRTALQYDGARPNLFEVSMVFPVGTAVGGASQQFTFLCRAAQLPGSTVNAVPVNYFGRELKFAGNRSFAQWSLTIINDENFTIRNSLESWMNAINSHAGNVRNAAASNVNGYTVDAVVTQFGKTGDVLKQYKFVGLFPIDVAPIDLDWGSNDSIEEYGVTFDYQWWESVPTTT